MISYVCGVGLCKSIKYQVRDMSLTILQLVVAAAILLGLSSPARAQLNYGRIFGAVSDQSGGAVAGATVTVLDVTRGVSRPLTTTVVGNIQRRV